MENLQRKGADLLTLQRSVVQHLQQKNGACFIKLELFLQSVTMVFQVFRFANVFNTI